ASWRSRRIPGSTSDEGSMEEASRTHIVLIPSYNPGARVYETVQAARRSWNPVWIVVDASTDRSEEHTSELQSRSDLVCRLLLERSSVHPDPHSFPTRRSSDLGILAQPQNPRLDER